MKTLKNIISLLIIGWSLPVCACVTLTIGLTPVGIIAGFATMLICFCAAINVCEEK